MSRSLGVTIGIFRRTARKILHNPAPAVPPMLIPLFMFTAISGAMSRVGSTRGFDYYNYTAFTFVFVMFMTAAFVGVFTGIEIASDYATGMGTRLMLAAPRRISILGGYVAMSVLRAVIGVLVVGGVAVLTGMPIKGDVVEIVGLVALALLLNVAVTLYGAGIALRLQSVSGSVLIFIPVFMAMFLTPAFIPRKLLSGWLHTAADINPLTPALEGGRKFMAHQSPDLVLAYGVTAGLVVFFLLWAATGMRRAEQGPGGSPRRRPRRPRS